MTNVTGSPERAPRGRLRSGARKSQGKGERQDERLADARSCREDRRCPLGRLHGSNLSRLAADATCPAASTELCIQPEGPPAVKRLPADADRFCRKSIGQHDGTVAARSRSSRDLSRKTSTAETTGAIVRSRATHRTLESADREHRWRTRRMLHRRTGSAAFIHCKQA